MVSASIFIPGVDSPFCELCSGYREKLVPVLSIELRGIAGRVFVALESASTEGRKLRSVPPPGSENRLATEATVLLLPTLSSLDIHEDVAAVLPGDHATALDVVLLGVHGAGRVVGPVVPGKPLAALLFDLVPARGLGGINDGFCLLSFGVHAALLSTFCAVPDGGFHGGFGFALTDVSLVAILAFKLFRAESARF